jgi:type VI secretion system protein ImpA
MLDLRTLLAPVNAGEPSGSLLEYDPAFIALFESAKGKPEQRMGSSVIAAEPPDWGRVETAAAALLSQTKDLRVATLLVKARLHVDGAAGLFEGLAFVRQLLERHWETIHPQLDPEDRNDPAMRVNALADLADPDTVLAVFRNAELASARGVGRVRVRDLERGDQAAAPRGDGSAEEKAPAVDAVFSACDRAALVRTARAAAAAVADLRAVEDFVREKVGGERGPNLSRLAGLLQLVARSLSARVPGEAPGAERAASPAEGSGAGQAPQGDGRGAAAPFAGEIRSRDDVVLALDGICAYYERFEPSSPIPLLLKRSRRLVAMGFMDIVRDLVPDAVPQVESLRGKQD